MNNPLRNRLALAVGLVILVTCGGAMAAAQSAHGLDAVRDSSGQEVARNYIVRGNSLSRDGRLNEAAEAYLRAVGHDPAAAPAYGNLGYVYTRLGRYAEAVEALTRAVRLQPDNPVFRYNLGNVYVRLDRPREAVEPLGRAVRLKPDYAEAHNDLGNAYAATGRHAEAVEALRQAIRLEPDFAAAYNNLGVVYHMSKRYKEAAESFRQAIILEADFAEAHYNLGMAYLALKEKGQALEQHVALKALAPALAAELLSGIYRGRGTGGNQPLRRSIVIRRRYKGTCERRHPARRRGCPSPASHPPRTRRDHTGC